MLCSRRSTSKDSAGTGQAGGHHDPLAAVSSLTLISNAVTAWNTIYMQRAVDGIEAMGGQPVQTRDLRRISKVSACAERPISQSDALCIICCRASLF